jgi:hypothetical protein
MAAMRASASEIGRPARRRGRGDLRVFSCGSAVERQYTTCKVVCENQAHDRLQRLSPFPRCQQCDAVEQLRLRDRRREQRGDGLGPHPYQDIGGRFWPQCFGQYIRIQDNHEKSGGSHMGPRGGTESSTPPNGSIRLRIASARFPVGSGSWANAVRKMSRASSSIERFRWAARRRNLRFTDSSRLRIVMLAIGGRLKSLQSE